MGVIVSGGARGWQPARIRNYAHGWRGNTTDEKQGFQTAWVCDAIRGIGSPRPSVSVCHPCRGWARKLAHVQWLMPLAKLFRPSGAGDGLASISPPNRTF